MCCMKLYKSNAYKYNYSDNINTQTQKRNQQEDVRIDTKLNKFLWSNGIRNIPKRVRVPSSAVVVSSKVAYFVS